MLENKNNSKIVPIILSIATLLLTLSMFIVVWNMRSQLIATWVLLVFQILIVLLGIAVSIIVSSYLVGKSFELIISKMHQLQRNHQETLRTFKKRITSFITTTVLIADAVLLIADKSFNDKAFPTMIISLFLLLFFWIANELIISKSKGLKYFGIALWIFNLSLLPTFIFVFNKDNPEILYNSIAALSPANKIIIIFTFFGFIIVPIAIYQLLKNNN